MVWPIIEVNILAPRKKFVQKKVLESNKKVEHMHIMQHDLFIWDHFWAKKVKGKMIEKFWLEEKRYIEVNQNLSTNSSLLSTTGWNSPSLVVSTIVFCVLFVSFSYCGECYFKTAFYFWRHNCSKKVLVEIESSLCKGGALTCFTFIALFHANYFLFTMWKLELFGKASE